MIKKFRRIIRSLVAGRDTLSAPGVYVEERTVGALTIDLLDSSVTAFVGTTAMGPENTPFEVDSFYGFRSEFGDLYEDHPMSFAVRDFFENGGSKALIVRIPNPVEGEDIEELILGDKSTGSGLFALKTADYFGTLYIPPVSRTTGISKELVGTAARFCEEMHAILVLDAPWESVESAAEGMRNPAENLGTENAHAVVYFPAVRMKNPIVGNQIETFPAGGAVAGVYARTDKIRGVWKAPAGLDAGLKEAVGLSIGINQEESEQLNSLNCNCLREFPGSDPVIWGSRTLSRDPEWRYVPVRRFASLLEVSVDRGTGWAVFEPNDEALWGKIENAVTNLMLGLFREGAFAGATPDDAFFVKCDRSTMNQTDLNQGILRIEIGFAPLKPAEFVILHINKRLRE